MKKFEIVLGGTYANRYETRIRRVVAVGPEFVCYDSQSDRDCLRYEIVKDGSKHNGMRGAKADITRTAFAN